LYFNIFRISTCPPLAAARDVSSYSFQFRLRHWTVSRCLETPIIYSIADPKNPNAPHVASLWEPGMHRGGDRRRRPAQPGVRHLGAVVRARRGAAGGPLATHRAGSAQGCGCRGAWARVTIDQI
jgi:hypothetical protein